MEFGTIAFVLPGLHGWRSQQRDCSYPDNCQVAWWKTARLWNFKVFIVSSSHKWSVVDWWYWRSFYILCGI